MVDLSVPAEPSSQNMRCEPSLAPSFLPVSPPPPSSSLPSLLLLLLLLTVLWAHPIISASSCVRVPARQSD
jgi:hypothetical protein